MAHEGVQVFPSDTAGVIAVGIAALAIACTLFGLARRNDPVTSRNVLDSAAAAAAPRAGFRRGGRVIVVASLQEYLPLGDIVRIVAVCIGVAVVAPAAAAL